MTPVRKAIAAALTSVFALTGAAVAEEGGADPRVHYIAAKEQQADPAQAQALVTESSMAMLAAMRAAGGNLDKQIHGLLEEHLLHHFDFDKIGRLVLGRHGRGITPDQRERFTSEFRELMVNIYAGNMLKVTVRDIDIQPVRGGNEKNTFIRTVVRPDAGPQIQVDYALYWNKQDEAWRIQDVYVEGISLVARYRSEFSSILSRNRGDMEALIDQLVRQNGGPAVPGGPAPQR